MPAKISHTERAHAILSASGASRWLACTPSARLEEEYGIKTTSPFAKEGTLAHEIAELMLRKTVFENMSEPEFNSQLDVLIENELFSEDMIDYVSQYVDYCAQQYHAAKVNDIFSNIYIEQKLDLTDYIPDSFGTGDCCIIGGNTLEIIDLKYGKGVPVYAEWNKQLMLYALGAITAFSIEYNIENVCMTIVQPRLNNISSFGMSIDELLDWAETELKPKAQLAFEGKGELVAGDHCKFCSVKNQCRALYEEQMELAKYDFKEPSFLTDEEISDILLRSSKFTEWINGIVAYAQEKAISGEKSWPGFKVVEGRSNRIWVNSDIVAETIMERMPEISEDEILEIKLKSLTAIEKIVGKKRFETELSDLIIKPEGKPTLVPENDKRPAIGIAQAKKDFE